MRKADQVFILMVAVNCLVLGGLTIVLAQGLAIDQNYINGGNEARFAAINLRLDHIENLANVVIAALIVNFIAQLVQLTRYKPRTGKNGRIITPD